MVPEAFYIIVSPSSISSVLVQFNSGDLFSLCDNTELKAPYSYTRHQNADDTPNDLRLTIMCDERDSDDPQ